ncbi:MAG: alpha/beta hydrolase [Bacteroidetes bacterium]|jgi:esterase/lipase|nr:alpha/beta hydrolase [Bacteroidota bacterium]
MWKQIATLCLVLTGGILVLIYFTSLFSISELVYPKRITAQSLADEEDEAPKVFRKNVLVKKNQYVTPSQLNLEYRDFIVNAGGSFHLNGWYVQQPDNFSAPTVLLLHDWNQSKISMLSMAEALFQLGFHVCLIDMPAHGESSGDKFLLNNSLNDKLKVVVDSLYCLYETNTVSVICSGLSAIPGTELAANDARVQILILQNPIPTVSEIINQQVTDKWNGISFLIKPLAYLKYEQTTGMSADSLNLYVSLKKITKPLLIALTDSTSDRDVWNAISVYDSVATSKKKIWTKNARTFIRSDEDAEKNIYRAMAAFINANIPKESPVIKSRKRIALK